MKAKAVLERDLALQRFKRAEREKVASALKINSLKESDIGKAVGKSVDGDKSKPKVVDLEMKNEEITTAEPSEHSSAGLFNQDLPKSFTGTGEVVLPASQGSLDPENAPTSIKSTESPNEQISKPEPTMQDVEGFMDVLDQQAKTSAAVDHQETDFDSMFDDNKMGGDGNLMDFDLDFSAGSGMDQELINEPSLDNVGIGNEDLARFNASSTEDINTLLPGLENFVNSADDFTMIDVQAPSTLLPSNSHATTSANAPPAITTAPPESNLDDLFPTSEFIAGTEDYDMNQSGNMDANAEFDEWFKT